EGDAVGLELALERGMVLDDAVVDDGHLPVAADVQVGVAVVRRAVRRPAGVANPQAPWRRPLGQVRRQVLDPAGTLANVQRLARERGQAGAVVPPVLQPPQALEQYGLRLAVADGTDDPAHARPHLRPPWVETDVVA